MFQQIDYQGYLQHKLLFQNETGRIQAWFPELVLQHSSEKNPAMLLQGICFSSLSELHSSIKAWLSLFSCLIVVSTFFPCSILVYIQRWLLSACRSFADFVRTLALRYNQIFGTSSLPPPYCMLPAIVWLIHAESVRCLNHRAVEWRRAHTMVSLLASHVVCTSIRQGEEVHWKSWLLPET